MNYRRLLTTASLAVLANAAGCSDGDESPPTDTGTDVTDVTVDAGDTGGDGEASTDTETPDEIGTLTFRITNVSIIEPAGVGGVLENLINNDIEDDALHILVQLSEFGGPFPTTATVTGNAGAIAEGGYSWYPGVTNDTGTIWIDETGTFANCETADDPDSCNTIGLIFPALEPGATEPLQIPVSSLGLSGVIAEVDGSWVMEGTLSGALLADEIAGINVDLSGGAGEGTPLADLLPDVRDYPPSAPVEERTGWRLEAEIVASEINFVE
ncbi:MAG: hypothetical protein H6697_03010 [Myxococcales bacterium]|nr:hypothetical protein [Myxococcales bacterium]